VVELGLNLDLALEPLTARVVSRSRLLYGSDLTRLSMNAPEYPCVAPFSDGFRVEAIGNLGTRHTGMVSLRQGS